MKLELIASACLIAALFSAPVVAQDSDLISSLPEAIAKASPTPTSDLLDATRLCESILSSPSHPVREDAGWVSVFEDKDGLILTRAGMVLIYRLQDGNFPTSCGVAANPASPHGEVLAAFAGEYGNALAVSDPDTTANFPTAHFASQNFTYRLQDAASPQNAITITVRHKED